MGLGLVLLRNKDKGQAKVVGFGLVLLRYEDRGQTRVVGLRLVLLKNDDQKGIACIFSDVLTIIWL